MENFKKTLLEVNINKAITNKLIKYVDDNFKKEVLN